MEDEALLREWADPQRAAVLRAAAVRAVGCELDVAAAGLAAAVLVALNDAGAAECAPSPGFGDFFIRFRHPFSFQVASTARARGTCGAARATSLA